MRASTTSTTPKLDRLNLLDGEIEKAVAAQDKAAFDETLAKLLDEVVGGHPRR